MKILNKIIFSLAFIAFSLGTSFNGNISHAANIVKIAEECGVGEGEIIEYSSDLSGWLLEQPLHFWGTSAEKGTFLSRKWCEDAYFVEYDLADDLWGFEGETECWKVGKISCVLFFASIAWF